MDKCDIFLLILSRNALNRCSNSGDNVRQEILEALDRNLAMIPVTAEDFVWPDKMPEGIEVIQDYNAIPYVQVYSDQFLNVSIPLSKRSEQMKRPGRTPHGNLNRYGEVIYPAARNNSYVDGRIFNAESDGTTSFSMVDNLKGNTTYYIRIDGNSKADYQIGISDHE